MVGFLLAHRKTQYEPRAKIAMALRSQVHVLYSAVFE